MTTPDTEIEDGRGLGVRGRTGRGIERIARDVFDWDPLRPGIARAVADLLEGRDVLGVMPTGYGKSADYQLAGALLPGTVVVVSPLIALQADQAVGLADHERARPAAVVNSAQPAGAPAETWARLADGSLGYLFLAPELLAKDDVVERLAAARIGLLVVDEAHCVPSWGTTSAPTTCASARSPADWAVRTVARRRWPPRPRARARCGRRCSNGSGCPTRTC